MVILEVPYAEKDLAKQMGARWNPALRKWYIPKGLDPEAFTAWLPASPDPREGIPRAPSATDESAIGISLSGYLEEVAGAITRGVKRSQWVRAELSQVRRTAGGHLQLELTEHDRSGQLIARLTAFLWSQRAEPIVKKFEQTTGAPLATGLKVLLMLSLDHNPTYGLRALLEDIDPSYTLGDIAKNLEAIRKRLVEANIFHLNQALPKPTEFTHIIVLSPEDAAGLGDFREDANRLEAHQLCRFTYHTALFQGPDASRSLTVALEAITSGFDQDDLPDALCIIRGGGAVTDLYWLNDFAVAQILCRMPIPVLTGIGHERDNTLLDEIANQRFDTPSKVIGHVVGSIYSQATAAIDHLSTIFHQTRSMIGHAQTESEGLIEKTLDRALHLLELSENSLGWLWSEIREESQTGLREADFQLIRLFDSINSLSENQLLRQQASLNQWLDTTLDRAGIQLHESSLELEALMREVLGMGPEATLRRGFVVARSPSGAPLTSKQKAMEASMLELQFHDGLIKVIPTHPPEESK